MHLMKCWIISRKHYIFKGDMCKIHICQMTDCYEPFGESAHSVPKSNFCTRCVASPGIIHDRTHWYRNNMFVVAPKSVHMQGERWAIQ